MEFLRKPKKLEQRVPWSIMDALVESLQLEILQELSTVSRVEVLGSYRRKKKSVGDFDVIAVESDRKSGTSKILHFVFKGIPGQLHLISPEDVESFRLFVTGSGNLNLLTRATAKRWGLSLNRYGLWENGRKIANTERGIFRMLNLEKYIDPTTRDIELDWKRN